MNSCVVLDQLEQATRTLKNIKHFETQIKTCDLLIESVNPNLRKAVRVQSKKRAHYTETVHRLKKVFKSQLKEIKNASNSL